MGTFIKYVFYIVLIAVLYIVISAMYNGDLNKNSTVDEVGTQIKSGAQNMISDTTKAVEDVVK